MFPIATVTKHHILSSLKQKKFSVSQFGVQETKIHFSGPKSRCCFFFFLKSQGVNMSTLPFEALREKRFWPLLASGGCRHSLACDHITPVSMITSPSAFLLKGYM